MKNSLHELSDLFDRDLQRLKKEIGQTRKTNLWRSKEGITNSCGILAQHIIGNLNHFIGAALGETAYIRDREKEFTNTGIQAKLLIEEIDKTRRTVERTLKSLSRSTLEEPYPLEIPMDYSTYQFLVHLYGHLNYHLGQYNYLRRILAENKG